MAQVNTSPGVPNSLPTVSSSNYAPGASAAQNAANLVAVPYSQTDPGVVYDPPRS